MEQVYYETQRAAVRDWLMKGKTLTALSAYDLCHTIRLSAIIFDLRHEEGLPILMERPRKKDGKMYAEYYMDKAYLASRDTQLALFND